VVASTASSTLAELSGLAIQWAVATNASETAASHTQALAARVVCVTNSTTRPKGDG